MLAGLQRQLCQIIMRIRSSGDHYDIHVRVLDQIIGGAVCLDARVILLRVVAWLRISLHNSVELEVRHSGDEGDVKDFGAEAVADYADVPRSRHDGSFEKLRDQLDSYSESTSRSYLFSTLFSTLSA